MPRTIIMLFIVILALGLAFGMHVNTLPLFAKNDIGATYADLGHIGLVKFLPYVVIPLFVGALLDRINNWYLLMLGILLHGIPLYMISTAATVPEIIVYTVAIGIAHAFIWPPTESILSNYPKNRVRYLTLYLLIFTVGVMVGPAIGVVILETTDDDFRLLFQISASVMLASMCTTVLVRTQLPKVKHTVLTLKSFGTILRFPIVVSVVLFCTSVVGLLMTIYPAYLEDRGLDASAVLILYTFSGATRVVGLVVVTKVHRFTEHILILSVVIVIMGMAISIIGTSFWHFAVAMVLLGLGTSSIYPISLEIMLSRTPANLSTKIIGASASLVGIGWLLGPLIGGHGAHVAEQIDVYWGFMIWGALTAIASIIFYKRLRVKQYRGGEWNAFPEDV